MLIQKKSKREKAQDMFDADGNLLQWDHGLRNIEREKSSCMAILGKLVPQAEIFLKSSSKQQNNSSGGNTS